MKDLDMALSTDFTLPLLTPMRVRERCQREPGLDNCIENSDGQIVLRNLRDRTSALCHFEFFTLSSGVGSQRGVSLKPQVGGGS